MESLKPVIITPDKYLSGILIPNELVPTKVATSVYTSVPNPIPGCKYLSWRQVSPPNRGSFGLSWLIQPNDTSEVIQFLTSQLNFKIKWSLDTCSNMRFLVINIQDNLAYEPWDIKGRRISFDGLRGCFTVPGQYNIFIIESSKKVNMKLEITGFFPKINLYTKNIFCHDGYFLYRNDVDVYGRQAYYLNRTLNPDLLNYQEIVLNEYRKNPGKPCLTKNLSYEQGLSASINFSSNYFYLNGELNYNNYIKEESAGVCTAKGYVNPTVFNVTSPLYGIFDVVSMEPNEASQFTLRGGTLYKLTISFEISLPSFAWMKENGLTDGTYVFGPILCLKDITFVMLSVADLAPVSFISDKSSPPPLDPNAGNTIVMVPTKIDYIGDNENKYVKFSFLNTNKYFVFFTPGNTNTRVTYATRIYNTSCYWNQDAFQEVLDAYGPANFKYEMVAEFL